MPKNVTVSVSDELARKMDAMPEINWSEVCRQCISRYIDKRSEEKGDLLKDLEEFLKTKLPKSEEKESVRKAEVERFTKKWGTPDYKTNTEEAPYYVTLLKTQKVNLGNQTVELEISNSRVLAKELHERVQKGFDKYDVNLYDKNLEALVEYFKSKGFTIAEEHFIQPMITHYVTKGDKAQARKLQDLGYWYFGLFAADKEDYVFIAYRKVKPK